MSAPYMRSLARPVPSATVLVLRDGRRGLEVLMIERARSIEFAGGATAFPGGKVTRGDRDPALWRYLARRRGVTRPLLARQAAAIREVFEETGLLLLRAAEGGRLLGEARRAALARRWRHGLEANQAELIAILRCHGLRIDPALLVPFAHWITPPVSPKRFDTSFFLARLPHGQMAAHDGWEAVRAQWLCPHDALRAHEAGKLPMMFPTRLNMMRLSRAHSVADALAQARRQPVITVEPVLFHEDGRLKARIPKSAGYGGQGVFDRVF
ncbi:MAG: NUDIX hydrolase [Pseudomonadota bacterium]